MARLPRLHILGAVLPVHRVRVQVIGKFRAVENFLHQLGNPVAVRGIVLAGALGFQLGHGFPAPKAPTMLCTPVSPFHRKGACWSSPRRRKKNPKKRKKTSFPWESPVCLRYKSSGVFNLLVGLDNGVNTHAVLPERSHRVSPHLTLCIMDISIPPFRLSGRTAHGRPVPSGKAGFPTPVPSGQGGAISSE